MRGAAFAIADELTDVTLSPHWHSLDFLTCFPINFGRSTSLTSARSVFALTSRFFCAVSAPPMLDI